jgi:hypothetical protein
MTDRFAKQLHYGTELLIAVGDEMKAGVAVFLSPVIAVARSVARALETPDRQPQPDTASKIMATNPYSHSPRRTGK